MLTRNLLGEALEPDAFKLPCCRMHGEAGQKFLQVAAPLAGAALGVRGHRHNQVSALQADRVVAWPEKEALDDSGELHVGGAVLGQGGEEAA